MAKVYFMFNNEDRKKITKSPADLFSAECIFKEDTSVFSPTMIISKSAAGAQWAQANYAYIPDLAEDIILLIISLQRPEESWPTI